MYPRLALLKQFLTKDGLLAVQIDDNEFAELYLILIDLFGIGNLKTICVKMSEATGVKMASVQKAGSIPKMKEFIIIAKKNGVKELVLERIAKEKWDDEYKIFLNGISTDEITRLKEIIDNEERLSKDVIEADTICAKFSYQNIEYVMKQQKISKEEKDAWLLENSWRIVRSVATTDTAKSIADKKRKQVSVETPAFIIETKQRKAYIIKNDYEPSAAQPRIKLLFADDYLTIGLGDLWTDIKTTGLNNEGSVDFINGKKPERLIQRIIAMVTNSGDFVLDSFLGSGTTAAVAMKMGRRFIGIEMGEHCETHCYPRLKTVVEGEQGGISQSVNWNGGSGFRYCKLSGGFFDANGMVSSEVRFGDMAAHVFFTETGSPLPKRTNGKTPFLGTFQNRAIYLLYNGILGDKRPNGGNVLTHKVVQNLPKYDGVKIVYGESCLLGKKSLERYNIVFRQIPFELKND
jgi:adenine-specific DNA-methyltransferase